ncbi:MAG: D-alanyl-D-alanine carboxypeptidase family protein [Eubacteriales bacterium]
MKKMAVVLLSISLIFGSFQFSYGAGPEPQIIGDAAVLIDGATGQVLFDKQMNKQKFPASTTKIMTSLLAVENLDMTQKVIIDSTTPFSDGTRIFLVEGEEVTVDQLLNAMLVESANDAAVAVGKEISGTIPEFTNLMNQRAKELGAKNTNFDNPNGLPDSMHLTTAYDLAMITKEALKHPEIRKAISTYRYVFSATNKQPERYLYNKNKLLFDTDTKVNYNGTIRTLKYDGATGVKTGFTTDAGYCLITSAKRDGMELIAVVLQSDSTNIFLDSIKLLDYGFANYKSVKVAAKDTPVSQVKVRGGLFDSVNTVIGEDVYATLPIDASPDILNTEVGIETSVNAPVHLGQKIGSITVFEANNKLGEFKIVANEDVPGSAWLTITNILNYIKYLVLAIALIFLGFIISWVMIKRNKIKRKKLQKHVSHNIRSKEKKI